jgi:hypothetical protein
MSLTSGLFLYTLINSSSKAPQPSPKIFFTPPHAQKRLYNIFTENDLKRGYVRVRKKLRIQTKRFSIDKYFITLFYCIWLVHFFTFIFTKKCFISRWLEVLGINVEAPPTTKEAGAIPSNPHLPVPPVKPTVEETIVTETKTTNHGTTPTTTITRRNKGEGRVKTKNGRPRHRRTSSIR